MNDVNKYKLWWVALVAITALCWLDMLCYAFLGFTLFVAGESGHIFYFRLIAGFFGTIIMMVCYVDNVQITKAD